MRGSHFRLGKKRVACNKKKEMDRAIPIPDSAVYVENDVTKKSRQMELYNVHTSSIPQQMEIRLRDTRAQLSSAFLATAAASVD